MALVTRISNRGVSIRLWKLETGGCVLEEETVEAGQLSEIALKCRTNPSCLRVKNRRIFAIRKMEAIENAVVIRISNSRFAIRNAARWWLVEE